MESAAGILLYRTRHNIEFLLVNDSFSNKRHWCVGRSLFPSSLVSDPDVLYRTPPKGKLIGQEDELKFVTQRLLSKPIAPILTKPFLLDALFA